MEAFFHHEIKKGDWYFLSYKSDFFLAILTYLAISTIVSQLIFFRTTFIIYYSYIAYS